MDRRDTAHRPPAVEAGRPEPFTEEELDWAIAKQRKVALFTTGSSWVLVGWSAVVGASVPTVVISVGLAVMFTWMLVRWLHRPPAARSDI